MRILTAAILCFILTAACGLNPANACTVFAVRDDAGAVYTVNQEDWGGEWAAWKPAEAALLAVPSSKNQLARVIFSWNGLSIEGGMNEKGLVYDFVALGDPTRLLPYQGRLIYPGPLGEKVLAECATVAEAIGLYQTYEESILGYGAAIISDAEGAAVIVYWNRAAGKVVIADRNTGLFMSDASGSVIKTNPEIFGLGARYGAVHGANPDPLTMETAMSLAALTVREETAYTCIYDQARRTVRVFYNHDLSRYADIEVSGSAIRTKRLAWVSTLMPGQAAGFHLPQSIFSYFAPLEKVLFLFALIASLSFLVQAFFKGRISGAVWGAYGGMLIVLCLNLAAMIFFGRLIRFYGFAMVHPAAGALPWALAAASLVMTAVMILGGKPVLRRSVVLTHGLIVAVIALGTAVFILSRGAVY
jgi:hypothetical protein